MAKRMEPCTDFSSSQIYQQDENSGFGIYSEFINAVRNKTKEEVIECLAKIKGSSDMARNTREDDKEETSNPPLTVESPSYRQKLLTALEKKDAGEVCNLIVEGKEGDLKTLENLNKMCESLADQDRLKEAGLIKYVWETLKRHLRCNGGCGNFNNCCENEQQPTEFQNEEEQQWIRILSDPLYISLEWLWRNNPNNEQMNASAKVKVSERKQQDVIEAALHDSHLLEKIASYEHHYSRKEYSRRAEEYEKFASDVVTGSNLEQLHQVMDVKGTGCLLQERPEDFNPEYFNQSLSLLKIAADKQRKRVCISFR